MGTLGRHEGEDLKIVRRADRKEQVKGFETVQGKVSTERKNTPQAVRKFMTAVTVLIPILSGNFGKRDMNSKRSNGRDFHGILIS